MFNQIFFFITKGLKQSTLLLIIGHYFIDDFQLSNSFIAGHWQKKNQNTSLYGLVKLPSKDLYLKIHRRPHPLKLFNIVLNISVFKLQAWHLDVFKQSLIYSNVLSKQTIVKHSISSIRKSPYDHGDNASEV